MKLILIRHAESEKVKKPNGFQLLNGSMANVHLKGFHIKKGLSKEIKEKLIQKGKELAFLYHNIDAVFCSALFRTKETMEGIIEGYKQVNAQLKTGNYINPDFPIPDFRLNEKDFGFLVSGIGSGIFNDDLLLKEAPQRDWLKGIKIETLKSLFPDTCKSINSNATIDYIDLILKENPENAIVIVSHSDLTNAGIESIEALQSKLTDFENTLLNLFPSDSTILIGSHGDSITAWLKNVEEDKTDRYNHKTHQALKSRDQDETKKKCGHFRFFSHLEHFEIELNAK